MVNEEIVKKRSDFCLSVEGWSILALRWLCVKQSGVRLLQTVRKSVTVTCNWYYVQINTGIPEKLIIKTSGHKSSKV